MFSDTAFWRLVWKEYRVQRSLLVAMLIVAPVVQLAAAFLFWINVPRFEMTSNDDFQHVAMNIAVVVSAIYIVCCSATMFSEEHETGSFDFQRLLPTSHRKALGAKLAFVLGSGILVTAWLWCSSLGVFARDADVRSTWTSGNSFVGLLVHLELLAWGILASLLVRQPLWAAIVAAAGQSVTTSFALLNFERLLQRESEWWHVGFLLVLSAVDFGLARRWFENRLHWPQWRWRLSRDAVASYPQDIELAAYVGQRQTGWSRLLWLSWRDSRWIIGCVLGCYFWALWSVDDVRKWELLIPPMFIGCALFGLFAFAPEQWGCRFRYMTEQGVSARAAWWCRQVVWLPPILLMVVITSWKRWQENDSYPHGLEHDAVERMVCRVLPWVLYAAGQFASMFCRRTPVALAVTMALCTLGVAWGGLMTTWLAPTWWAVGAWFVIGLFATWLRAPDWIEERRDRTTRRRLWGGIGIPFALLLVALGTYRVVQIPQVTLPAKWDDDAVVKARLSPAQLETLDVYRRAIAEILRIEAELETYSARWARLKREHGDWSKEQLHPAAFKSFYQEWQQKLQHVVPLLRTAHTLPAVPVNLLESEFPLDPNDDRMPERRSSKLLRLMEHEIESRIAAGDLPGAWSDIEIGLELVHRVSQRGAMPLNQYLSLLDISGRERLLNLIAKWGQHADQNQERVLIAIRALEEREADFSSAHSIAHDALFWTESSLRFDENWQRYVRQNEVRRQPIWVRETAAMVWPKVWTGLFWERWRSGRFVRWQAARALDQADVIEQALRDQRHIPRQNFTVYPSRLEGSGGAEENARLAQINEAIVLSFPLSDTTIVPPFFSRDAMSGLLQRELIQHCEQYRATVLSLALTDFKRQQGHFPQSLSELAPTYFPDAPRDPTSAGPFVYFPNGLPKKLRAGSMQVPQDVPFLVTNLGQATAHFEAQSGGTWTFRDYSNKPISVEIALKHARIHLLETPPE